MPNYFESVFCLMFTDHKNYVVITNYNTSQSNCTNPKNSIIKSKCIRKYRYYMHAPIKGADNTTQCNKYDNR